MQQKKPIIDRIPSPLLSLPLFVLTVYAFRHSFPHFDANLPPWEYLWDDRKNFVDNAHLSLTFPNIQWALTDGVILGVYEPISLIIKMILHDLISFDPQRYRILSTVLHAINVCLAFHVGRAFLNSVNDYGRTVEGWIRDGKGAVSRLEEDEANVQQPSSSECNATSADQDNGNKVRRRKGKKGQDKDGAGGVGGSSSGHQSLSEARTSLSLALAHRTYLHRHQTYTTILCLLGTAIFAVHPLQSQSIGWISCLSYILSCFFALLSFWAYVRHRTGLREWRRYRRAGDGADTTGRLKAGNEDGNGGRSSVVEPWRILPSAGASKGKRGGKGNRRSNSVSSGAVAVDEAETWLLTRFKVQALVLYALATFCKSPSVTLPLVFIIVDVFIYSCPLSVHPGGPDALTSAVGAAQQSAAGTRGGAEDQKNGSASSDRLGSSILPHRALPKFCNDAFPSLVQLTIRALQAWTTFLIAAFLMTIFLVRGNTKNLLDVLSPLEKLEKSVWALAWYVSKLFVPTNLVAAVEQLHGFSPFDHWEVALSLLVIPYGTVTMLAYSLSNSPGRVLTCAWGSFIALLLPSLGFIQHGRLFLAADRYMYIPLVLCGPILGAIGGACVTLICGSPSSMADSLHAGGPVPASIARSSGPIDAFDGEKLSAAIIAGKMGSGKASGGKGKGRKVADQAATSVYTVSPQLKAVVMAVGVMSSIALVVLLGVCAVSTTPYNYHFWRNTLLLWSRNVELFPDTENAHVNLAGVYTNDERHYDLDKALYHQKIAILMRPDSAKYQANLGILYGRRNEMEEAKEVLSKALRDYSRSIFAPLMHKVYGQALYNTGDWQAALKESEIAFARGEKSAMAEINRLMEEMKDPANELKQREKWKKIRAKQIADRELRESAM